jgi:hypothetical protein
VCFQARLDVEGSEGWSCGGEGGWDRKEDMF